jgi:muramoyltetrapeptide carboxypeptidase
VPSAAPPASFRKPPRLRPGDLVAVVAPAGPVPHARLVRGVRELERQGLRVRLGANVLAHTRYLAGDDTKRAVDLLSLWAHPEVKAIFAARGGYGSGRIVEALTPAFLRRHPKIFCGFSDNTTIHLACRRAGLVTFHGPMVGWDLAAGKGRGGRTPLAARRLLAAGDRASKDGGPGVTRSGGYEPESFRACLFGEGARGLVLAPPAAETLVAGRTRGRLAGGCLSLIVASLGCREQLDARGAILLLEDVIEPPFRVDRMLTQLRRAGVFDGVRGIVLGDFPACHPERDAGFALADVLRDRLGDLGVPVVWRFPYGHTARPALTLPLGTRVALEATRRPRLVLAESPVAR